MEKRETNLAMSVVYKTVFLLLALWFLYVIRDIILLLIISIILVSAMEPAVDYFKKKKVPRAVTVLGIYIIFLVIVSVAVSFLFPPLVKQFQDLSQNFSQYSQKFEDSLGPINNFIQMNHINLGTSQLLGDLGNTLSSFGQNIFSKTIGVFSGLISIVVVFSMAFYMSVEENGIKSFATSIVPIKHIQYAAHMTERIKDKLGRWMLGQMLVMFIIFVLDSVGLYLAGVPYPLILGMFAGFMELIPYVGPIISGIPGVILGFIISPTTGLLAFAIYFIAQQFEGNVVIPLVMKKAVGLNPITVILVLLIGAKLAGVLGVILSVPVATAISLFVKDVLQNQNEKQTA